MKLLTIPAVVLVCAAVAAAVPMQKENDKVVKSELYTSVLGDIKSEFENEFREWKDLYKKEYKSFEEELSKFSIWLNNLRYVNQHNLEASLKEHSFTLALNEYSDLSIYDVRARMNGFKQNKTKRATPQGTFRATLSSIELPASVDWRQKGYVTEVKNQGDCGSCWSFSTTGSLEGQHFKKTGSLVSLSEQNLIDCSGEFGNQGCNGGLMDNAFEYVKENKGLDLEVDYPYEAEDDTCRFKIKWVGATDSGYVDVTQGDENALQEAVATVGPISIAIDASHMSFQMYSGGVYDEPECSSYQLDHGVLVVGYGSEDGKDYWIVKNSWGESWGENGYIKMARNQNNQCGIASSASYPLV